MPSVFTIEGAHRSKKSSGTCKRVRSGKRGCTIELCKGSRGRWKFKKGTYRCSR